MAKKVIPDTMVNELSGGSSLFTRSPTPKPISKASPKPVKQTKNKRVVNNATNSKPIDKTPDRPDDRTDERTDDYHRIKTRYAFEFYQDQITRIKELKRSALINDRPFAMSEWVRRAIDKALKEVDRTGERSNER